tara:strand:+ start:6445 stop:6696 length:252 start_codon:yes stop_codon:yes gene_type:complete
MSSKKLSEEEVKQLKDFQLKNNEIVVALGSITLRIDALERQEESELEKFQNLQLEQNKFAQELQNNYGDGNIDLEKGEFTPAE